MEILRRILSSIWKVWFGVNFIAIFLVLLPFLWILLMRRKWFPVVFVIERFWAWWITFFAGIYIKKYSRTDLSKLSRPCVIVANHASYMDIVVSYLFLPHYFVFMAKAELAKVPLFGILFKEMNITVNRKSVTDAHRAFIKAGEEIDRGNSIYIFPEGKLSSDGEYKPLKNGAFKLAIDKQIPVLPVTYINNWKILQNGGFFKSFGGPGIAKIVIHEPISTVGMTEENLVPLRQQVYELTKKTLEEFKNN